MFSCARYGNCQYNHFLLQMCLNRLQLTQGDVENGGFSPEQKQQQDKDDEREDMGKGRVIETFLDIDSFLGHPPNLSQHSIISTAMK